MTTARIIGTAPPGLSLDGFGDFAKRMEREHGPGLNITQWRLGLLIIGPGDVNPAACWCASCEAACLKALPMAWSSMRQMCLCPTCGNKRCPRATHHDHECSGSNEPGQVGSNYGTPCGCHREAS